jgi:hypothetical protein
MNFYERKDITLLCRYQDHDSDYIELTQEQPYDWWPVESIFTLLLHEQKVKLWGPLSRSEIQKRYRARKAMRKLGLNI